MLLRITTCYTCNARGAARRPRALSDLSPPSFSLSRWRGPRLFPAGDALSAFTLVQDRLCPAFSTWSPCLSVSHLCHHSSVPCGLRSPQKTDSLSDRSPFRCFYVQIVKLLWLGKFKSIVARQFFSLQPLQSHVVDFLKCFCHITAELLAMSHPCTGRIRRP